MEHKIFLMDTGRLMMGKTGGCMVDGIIKVINPVDLIPIKGERGQNLLQFAPFLLRSEPDSEVEINADRVVATGKPDAGIVSDYDKLFNKVQVVSNMPNLPKIH